ncbi:MAG: hypothetical protein JXB14_06655, partial [Candidatus Altiarchaeota archaeon]|nr:hypothetical protein [Candidatus Altiarchaeota archaeon]
MGGSSILREKLILVFLICGLVLILPLAASSDSGNATAGNLTNNFSQNTSSVIQIGEGDDMWENQTDESESTIDLIESEECSGKKCKEDRPKKPKKEKDVDATAAETLNVLPWTDTECFWFDSDADGDVDQADSGRFQNCISGAGNPPAREVCLRFDYDEDGDVDYADQDVLDSCFSGDGVYYPGLMSYVLEAFQSLKALEESITETAIVDPLDISTSQRSSISSLLDTIDEQNPPGMAVVNGEFYLVPQGEDLFSYRVDDGPETVDYYLVTEMEPVQDVFMVGRNKSQADCIVEYSDDHEQIYKDLRCVMVKTMAQHPDLTHLILGNEYMQQDVRDYLDDQSSNGNIDGYNFDLFGDGTTNYKTLHVDFSDMDRDGTFTLELFLTDLYGPGVSMEGLAQEDNDLLNQSQTLIMDDNSRFKYTTDSRVTIAALWVMAKDLPTRTRARAIIDALGTHNPEPTVCGGEESFKVFAI